MRIEGLGMKRARALPAATLAVALATAAGLGTTALAGAPTTVYLAVALIYLLMTLPLTALVRRLETRL